MTAPDVPDGFALLCMTCRWRPDPDLTQGLLAAHFVAICPRCDQPMRHDFSHGLNDHFACDQCHRSRVVRRTQ